MAWLCPPMQQKIRHQPGDTIISVPAKSGTTWAMNIFHQLKTGGDPDFKDIYLEVPWAEFKERPDQPEEELLERWEKMPRPLAFKSHSCPGDAPGSFVQFREDMKYVVVMRNPEEAIVSFQPFIDNHNQAELIKLWGAPVQEMFAAMKKPTFDAWFKEVALPGMPGLPPIPGGMLTMFFFGFINGWWPLRNKPNVLMLHFSQMKKDHEGSVRKIAKHLGFEPTAEQWPNILEYTSFKWMKANESKFEVPELLPFKLLLSGAMVRKGASGKQAEDGMTPEISAVISEWATKMVPDDAARRWMYEGGEIPP